MSLFDLSDKAWLNPSTPNPRGNAMSDWRNMPGPGDPETWPVCTGHPMDPRTPEPLPDEECGVEELCERYSGEELATMLQAVFAEANLLRARLRKAEAELKAKP